MGFFATGLEKAQRAIMKADSQVILSSADDITADHIPGLAAMLPKGSVKSFLIWVAINDAGAKALAEALPLTGIDNLQLRHSNFSEENVKLVG